MSKGTHSLEQHGVCGWEHTTCVTGQAKERDGAGGAGLRGPRHTPLEEWGFLPQGSGGQQSILSMEVTCLDNCLQRGSLAAVVGDDSIGDKTGA